MAFGNLLFGTFLLSLCLPLLLERERKVRFLCRRTESRPKLMVIALCIVASSCCCHASTSYDVMHVDSSVACICNWLLRRPSSSYASLPLPLSPDSIEDGGACRKASGGDGREGNRREEKAYSSGVDRDRRTGGQTMGGGERGERDKPIEDRLALSGVKER